MARKANPKRIKGYLFESFVNKLVEKGEVDAATYGLENITKIVTSDPNEKSFGLFTWVIPNYERVAVEGFKFDPNISGAVLSQFRAILKNLKRKTPFVLNNISSSIAVACFNIVSVIKEPYSQIVLVPTRSLLQKIIVDLRKTMK